MTRRIGVLVLVLGLVASCTSRPPSPDLKLGQTIAVAPVENRTGDPLLVQGASFIDRYALRAERVTVGDVLAAEARSGLSERGFHVLSREAGTDSGLVLHLEIRHWEPDAPIHPAFVIVGLSASLVDPATGEVVWQLDRRTAPVATPGEVTLENAYITAARKVMAEIVAPFGR